AADGAHVHRCRAGALLPPALLTRRGRRGLAALRLCLRRTAAALGAARRTRPARARVHQRLVVRGPGPRGHAPERFADDLERHVVELLEADAGLAHVELLAG